MRVLLLFFCVSMILFSGKPADRGGVDAADLAKLKPASGVRAEINLSRGVSLYLHPGVKDDVLVGMDDSLNQFTPEDAKRLRELGITHIRLAVVPYPLLNGIDVPPDFKHGLGPEYLRAIHGMIQRALNENLTVVLAVMANDDVWWRLVDDTDYASQWERFFALWGEEFHHYAPDRLVLETLNEPRLERLRAMPRPDGAPRAGLAWPELQRRLLGSLRTALPHHTLVAVGEGMSSAAGLMALPPLEDRNLIYAFHDYNPYLFTHQGADWTELTGMHGVRYPTPHLPCTAQSAAIPAEHRKDFTDFCRQDWNAAQARKRAARMAAWAKERGVRVWLAEFGTYPAHNEASDVQTYLGDMREAYAQAGIGWCAWEYANWLERLDRPDLRQALGLESAP